MSEKLNLSTVAQANVTATRFVEKQVKGKEWVAYGENNRYPDYLWDKYINCPTQQSIIDAKTAFTMGSQISGGGDIVNTKNECLHEVLERCVMDLHIFGGFAIQVIYNVAGEIIETYWADFSKLRINYAGNKIYWCENWGGWNIKPIEYDVFNPNMTNKTTQILYYRGNKCRSVYPIPSYISALTAIETEVEIQNYHLNAIHNGFAVNAIVNFNGGVPDEEERKKLEEQVNAKFSGSHNAGRTLISWNDSKDTATSVERLDTDNFDKKFAQLRSDSQEAIFIAHRITSGTLLGRLPQNTGFTRNEYEESYDIFSTTVIAPYQKELITVIKKIFPDREMTITPFYIEETEK